MTEVRAKEVKGKHGTIGWNVYFMFQNEKPLKFMMAGSDLSQGRTLDEISQICTGRNAEIEEAKCCKSDQTCVCAPNALKMYIGFILVALIFVGIVAALDYSIEKEYPGNDFRK